MKNYNDNSIQRIDKKTKIIHLVLLFFIFLILSMVSVAAPMPELVKDVREGSSGSNMYNLRAGNSYLFFTADDGINGLEVWRSDGSDAGTIRTTDTSLNSNVTELRYSSDAFDIVHDVYFFPLYGNVSKEHELWRSGTTGTFKLATMPDHIHTHATTNNLYFFAPFNDPVYGRELWVSSGELGGTRMVKDIAPGRLGSSPRLLTPVDEVLYFISGNDLWISDGSSTGTRLLANFENHYTKKMLSIFRVNDMLFLNYMDDGHHLLRHDIVSAQTTPVKILDGISSLYHSTGGITQAAIGNQLFFSGKDETHGYELWKSDGTPNGTVLVKDIWTGISYNNANSSTPHYLTNVEGTLFFVARNEEHGNELWKSNGKSSGTLLVKDITAGERGSEFSCFTAVGNTLFFSVKKSTYVTNLWMSDGTEQGTVDTGFHSSSLRCPVVFNNQLYLYGYPEGKEFGVELYRINLGNTTPEPPVLALSMDNTRVSVSWESVANAQGYILYYAPYPFVGSHSIRSINLGNKTSLSVNLWKGAAFYVAVKAYSTDFESEYSNIKLFIVK